MMKRTSLAPCSVSTAARRTATASAVRQYCEMGLLGEEGRQGPFGEGTLFLVRRIEQLRIEYGMPAEGAGLVLDLAARIEELEEEIRALREAMGR